MSKKPVTLDDIAAAIASLQSDIAENSTAISDINIAVADNNLALRDMRGSIDQINMSIDDLGASIVDMGTMVTEHMTHSEYRIRTDFGIFYDEQRSSIRNLSAFARKVSKKTGIPFKV